MNTTKLIIVKTILIAAALTSITPGYSQDSKTGDKKEVKVIVIEKDGKQEVIVENVEHLVDSILKEIDIELDNIDIDFNDHEKKVIVKHLETGKRPFHVRKTRSLNTDRPFLGVEFRESKTKELEVTKVVEGSAADIMVLKKGDEIIEMNGIRVNGDIVEALNKHRAGDKVVLKVKRGRRLKHIEGILGRKPDAAMPISMNFDNEGFIVKDLTPARKPMLGVFLYESDNMVTVSSVIDNSAAQDMGLESGDIIKEINNIPISSRNDVLSAIKEIGTGNSISVKYLRNGLENLGKANIKEMAYAPTLNKQIRVMRTMEHSKNNFDWKSENGNAIVKVLVINEENNDVVVLKSSENGNEKVRVFKSDLAIESLEIFPNPTKGSLKLAFGIEEGSDVTLKVFDINNREIEVQNFTGTNDRIETQLELGNNPPGVYLLQIEKEGKSLYRKIILE